MKIKKTPEQVWKEYQEGTNYKSQLFENGLYEQVKKNENFYNGNQWEGVDAPNLDKPVFNFIKRVTSYMIANIVSDDIAVSMEFFDDNEQNHSVSTMLQDSIESVMEQDKTKSKYRQLIRNECVDGDMCVYWYYDVNDTTSGYDGVIKSEIVDNTNIYFGNPYSSNVQKQPYIIISQRLFLGTVRDMAIANGMSEEQAQEIVADTDHKYMENKSQDDLLVTVLTKMWKENGVVHVIKTTEKAVLEEEKVTEYTMYPVAYSSWESTKNSYHGNSPISSIIPNQILVNKIYAMCSLFIQNMAFPRLIYDKSRMKELTTDFTKAIGVPGLDGQNTFGNVIEATKAVDFSSQIMPFLEMVVSNTKELMGASDTALGEVKPNNTSAIIALSEATAMPLEIQRLGYHDFVEDCVRIILELMSAHYGVREAKFNENGETTKYPFDYSQLRGVNYALRVDVGTSTYWSELTQQQTLDNLFAQQIISDPIDYLEAVPSKNLKGKEALIQKMKAQRDAVMQQQQAMQAQQAMPQQTPITADEVMAGLSPEAQAFVEQNPQVLEQALQQQ